MNESLKQIRLNRSKEFNDFCDRILNHDGKFPKPIIRELANYRRLFRAILGDPELREMAADDLRRLTVIEIYVKAQA